MYFGVKHVYMAGMNKRLSRQAKEKYTGLKTKHTDPAVPDTENSVVGP